jgi:hypothetical protein
LTTESLTIDQVLSLLAAAPPRLAVLTAGLAPGQLHSAPIPGEWSVIEVLVRTVHSYTQWLARHERPHIKQVERLTNILRE